MSGFVGHTAPERGFTLVELSIVMVIIGLLVGSVLVGQDLIAAARARAQLAQIDKYNAAVNMFSVKYANQLPGDMNADTASSFNFVARGAYPAQGDGNGIIQGAVNNSYGCSTCQSGGETVMFWVDLSAAQLIEGSFTTATPNKSGFSGDVSGAGIARYLPQAKMGQGNYLYVWSGGWSQTVSNSLNGVFGDRTNYFGLSVITDIGAGLPVSVPGLTAQQAYSMDKKVDDGLPQSGSVAALHIDFQNGATWAMGGTKTCFTGGGNVACAAAVGAHDSSGGPVVAGDGVATSGSATTCYDNGGSAGATETYSQAQKSGNLNCALSFQF